MQWQLRDEASTASDGSLADEAQHAFVLRIVRTTNAALVTPFRDLVQVQNCTRRTYMYRAVPLIPVHALG